MYNKRPKRKTEAVRKDITHKRKIWEDDPHEVDTCLEGEEEMSKGLK